MLPIPTKDGADLRSQDPYPSLQNATNLESLLFVGSHDERRNSTASVIISTEMSQMLSAKALRELLQKNTVTPWLFQKFVKNKLDMLSS